MHGFYSLLLALVFAGAASADPGCPFFLTTTEIEPGLLISPAPPDWATAKKLGIDAVVKAAREYDEPRYPKSIEGSKTFTYPFSDNHTAHPETVMAAAVRLAWLRGQGKKVLVHCSQGISRSPYVVWLYLAATRNLSWKDALELLRAKNKDFYPAVPFLTPAQRETAIAEARAAFARDESALQTAEARRHATWDAHQATLPSRTPWPSAYLPGRIPTFDE